MKGDEFYITMNCGAQAEAKKLGVTLDFQGPDQFDASLQTPIVNAVAAKKPDAMLIAPTDTKAMYAPIKQVAAGAKVVLVDTTLENADMAVSQIASDNEAGGRAAAQELAKLIGGNGKVFVVNVKPGISTTDLRGQGLRGGGQEARARRTSASEYSQDQPDKAAAIVKAQLAKNPDLKGIFATNLFSAEGSATGLERPARTDVKIVRFDAGPKQVEDLKDGTCRRWSPRSRPTSAPGRAAGVAALKGEATKPKIATGSVIITKDNLDQNQDAVYKSNC